MGCMSTCYKLRQLAANAAGEFAASGELNPLATLPVAAGYLQLYQLQENQPLAAISTTCSAKTTCKKFQ